MGLGRGRASCNPATGETAHPQRHGVQPHLQHRALEADPGLVPVSWTGSKANTAVTSNSTGQTSQMVECLRTGYSNHARRRTRPPLQGRASGGSFFRSAQSFVRARSSASRHCPRRFRNGSPSTSRLCQPSASGTILSIGAVGCTSRGTSDDLLLSKRTVQAFDTKAGIRAILTAATPAEEQAIDEDLAVGLNECRRQARKGAARREGGSVLVRVRSQTNIARVQAFQPGSPMPLRLNSKYPQDEASAVKGGRRTFTIPARHPRRQRLQTFTFQGLQNHIAVRYVLACIFADGATQGVACPSWQTSFRSKRTA